MHRHRACRERLSDKTVATQAGKAAQVVAHAAEGQGVPDIRGECQEQAAVSF